MTFPIVRRLSKFVLSYTSTLGMMTHNGQPYENEPVKPEVFTIPLRKGQKKLDNKAVHARVVTKEAKVPMILGKEGVLHKKRRIVVLPRKA